MIKQFTSSFGRYSFYTALLLAVLGCTLKTVNATNKPTGLSINFLSHADQVFLNGYSVNTSLCDAISRKENYQFAEIAQKNPFFGWVVNSDQNNTLQTAYQIIIASSIENIENNNGDYWDSGKVESNQSINIDYKGKPLKPNSVYFWKVKTWDNHGVESDYSAVSQFKTAAELVDYATARYPLQKRDESPAMLQMISKSEVFVDFGKDAFGRLRLTLDGKDGGDTITIHLGESMKDGKIDRNPGGTIRYSSYKLILKGGWNTYVIAINPDKRNTGPRAVHLPDYIGEVTPFRYCEINGYSGSLGKQHIVRETVSYPFDEIESYFSSSDTVLNQVWDLCKYSMKATSFAGIFVDGDRERIAYEADALINQLGFYSVVRDYSIARSTHEYLINHPTWPTEWILQSVLIAWNDYLYTGNKESLVQFYKDLQAKTLSSLSDDAGFISTRTGKVSPDVLKSIHLNDKLNDIVDWPQTGIVGEGKSEKGETDGFVFKDINTVVNAYYYSALKAMSAIAGELGKKEDCEYYLNRATKLKEVFNEKLIDKKKQIYTDGVGSNHASLHANIFPLAFGMASGKDIDEINKFISSRGMACSVYGSQFLLDAVYDCNNSEYGLQLLTSTAERSWYNMIRAGSTITMEAWDNKYKPNQDWNHAWGAAPANIIPRRLMGIEPIESGFRKMRIKPQPAWLERAEIRYPTIRGEVLVSFKNVREKSFRMDLCIPANTTAEVWLPLYGHSRKVMMDGKKIRFLKDKKFAIIGEVGSGNHTFEVYY